MVRLPGYQVAQDWLFRTLTPDDGNGSPILPNWVLTHKFPSPTGQCPTERGLRIKYAVL